MDSINLLLLVEDDENDVIITTRKINRSNLQIKELIISANLQETKDILQKRSVDVVLLDLNLPDSKGLDTLDNVRPVYSGILIVLTSIDDELIGIEAIRKGADEYIVKSYLNERLLSDSIYHAIERRKRSALVEKVHSTFNELDNIVKKNV